VRHQTLVSGRRHQERCPHTVDENKVFPGLGNLGLRRRRQQPVNLVTTGGSVAGQPQGQVSQHFRNDQAFPGFNEEFVPLKLDLELHSLAWLLKKKDERGAQGC